MMSILLLLAVFTTQLLFLTYAYEHFNIRPKQTIDLSSSSRRFRGRFANLVSKEAESDFFKLLEREENYVLVGARDVVYNLSIATMRVKPVLEWAPQQQVIEDCVKKGKSKHLECHNYIRVLARQPNGRTLICGTHAYSPKCREYVYSPEDNSFQQRREFNGWAIIPYDPRHNSTAVYIPETKEIYAGTVSDFAGNDPLIYRKPVSESSEGIRTQRDVLDSPNFVGSFAYHEHVYFWYREWASETNELDKQVYARVARVCKSDRGGRTPTLSEKWTSFVKARLNCSIPSSTPFYFNELQAVTNPIKVSSGQDVVYAVFSTPENVIQMSAVCAFTMKAIEHLFDHEDFKIQENAKSMWTSHRYSKQYRKLPVPRPGSCVPDSTKLDNIIVSFITQNPLMHPAVPALSKYPVYIQGPEKAPITQIAVVSQLKAVDGIGFNAIYLGTTDGHVLKLVQANSGFLSLVESVRIFKNPVPIVNLITIDSQLFVVSADEIASIPLHHCEQQNTCSGCVSLRDGHCSWDISLKQCVWRSDAWQMEPDFVQNLWSGKSDRCPEREGTVDYQITTDGITTEHTLGPGNQSMQSSTSRYGFLILFTILALVIGFLGGYYISRWRTTHEMLRHSSASSSGSDYDSYGRARLTRHDSLTAAKIDHVYANPPGRDVVSLVLTMPQNGGVLKTAVGSNSSTVTTPKSPIEKNLVATLNNGTLPKDYKVKKVYL